MDIHDDVLFGIGLMVIGVVVLFLILMLFDRRGR